MKLLPVLTVMCVTLFLASCDTTDVSQSESADLTDHDPVLTETVVAEPIRRRFVFYSANGVDSYTDILKGKSFEDVILEARLTLPAKCSQPDYKVPAVIIQHGAGAPRHQWYEELSNQLAEVGIAALVPNSFSARDIKSTTADQTQLPRANRVYDAFAAFRTLARHPCIDPNRIGITGYGFGGIVSRDVVESELAARLGEGRVFKASLPVYPSCQSQWDVSQPTNTRVHFLLAEKDDYTPVNYCLDHIPQLKDSG